MGTLVRGGEIWTAIDRYVADIFIAAGKIQAIGEDLPGSGDDEILDATGLLVFPGGVDAHTHLDMPFMGASSTDDFQTGTIAAAVGGTTTIVDFVIPERSESLLAALGKWHAKAAGKAVIDYAFHMALTRWDEGVAREISRCVYEEGITSFKAFMAYKGSLGVDDYGLFQFMSRISELGALLAVHAENGDVIQALLEQYIAANKTHPRYHAMTRPAQCEGEATERAIGLARLLEWPIYLVHMSCREALASVKRAQKRGQQVFSETCPQYLLLDDSRYDEPDFGGAKYVMSPPLRKAEDNAALWAALRQGAVQVVATDHCPFNFAKEKQLGRDNFAKIPNGCPGIEDRLTLLWTHGVQQGRIDGHTFVKVCSTNPAKILGLYPQKGAIAVGSDGDLVLFDPTASRTITARTQHQRVDYNTFEGFAISGMPSHVLLRGQMIVREGKFTGIPGTGRYLARKPAKVRELAPV
ncbi:MAG: dihydropyrimidinase [Cyanobacteria bacterium NC_groundwater_1444_Ag_S-0.65um_54_12]|nr:dihydropyrimidinase [Cyanobacteria bacterium NC_groundwater_1444_Ag_S-0.65um_54_12]